MSGHSFYFFFLLWVSIQIVTGDSENKDPEKDTLDNIHLTMAPNSKFLNPHVDDATNLQFAVAAFKDEPLENDRSKSNAAEILTKLTENLAASAPENPKQNEKTAKALRDWRFVSFLQSLITGNNNKLKQL